MRWQPGGNNISAYVASACWQQRSKQQQQQAARRRSCINSEDISDNRAEKGRGMKHGEIRNAQQQRVAA